MNKNSYAVFLDIDGTLLGRDEDALKKNISIIQKVRSIGHKVYICTGRSAAYLPAMIDYEKSFDGIITGAGARIVMDGEVAFCSHVSFDAIKRFCDFSHDKPNIGMLEGTDVMFYFGDDGIERPTCVKLDAENVYRLVNENTRIEKFAVTGVVDPQLSDIMGEDFIVMQHNGYAEVLQRDCSKSKAMLFVLEKLGFHRENSVAMGDSMNDFDMIEQAGIGVAMGNAITELKNIADMITEDVNDAGVAVALEKIFDLK